MTALDPDRDAKANRKAFDALSPRERIGFYLLAQSKQPTTWPWLSSEEKLAHALGEFEKRPRR
jgi:hypothetical protein